MPCTRWISVPATVVAFALTFTTLGVAQSATAAPGTAGAPGARPLILGPISGSSVTAIDRQVPEQVLAAEDLGVAPSNTAMTLQLLLQRSPEQQYALKELNAEVLYPGSANYHQMLTPEQFGQTFGLATSDLTALKSWLESEGFKVTDVDNGRLVIAFTGTAADVERAFQTEIHNYKGLDGKIHYANATGIHLPTAIVPAVAGLLGLENFSAARSPGFDGPVLANSSQKQTNETAKAAPATVVPQGVTEFHNNGSVITSTIGAKFLPDTNGLPTTTTVALNPNVVTYGTNTVVTVTGTISWTGGGTPTGSITFYDNDGYLQAQVLLTSANCTLGTNQYVCTYSWYAASAATPSPDKVTAAYSGDTTYASSSGTANQTINANNGTGFLFSSFTDNPTGQVYDNPPVDGVALSVISATFAFGEAPTGTLLITGNGGIGLIAYGNTNGTCFFFFVCYFDDGYTWNPSATLLPGVYTLTAAYSGNSNYGSGYTTTTYTVTGDATVPTTTTLSASPNYVSAGNPGTTFTTVTTWTGSGVPPTGSLDITGPAGTPNGRGLGSLYFPVSGATTSVGAGVYDGGAYNFTYNCTTNTSAKSITCTVVDSNVYTPLPNATNVVTATYHGDETYEASAGTTDVYKVTHDSTTTVTSGTPTVTYGLGTTVNYSAVVKGTAGNGQPTGTVSFSGTPLTGSPVVVTIVAGDCTFTGNGGNRVYTCTVPSGAIAVPPLTSPGAYTVTATYSGSTTYGGSTGTVTETVVKQTPSLTAPTVVPNTVGQGSTGPVALTTTFAWAGTGLAPTGAVTFTVDGATVGTATCVSAGTDTETCTYSYNPSALTTGGHTVRAVYAGDTNYNSVTSGGTTLTVNPLVTPTLTLVVAPAGTTAVGIASGTLVTLTATLTVPTNAGAWNGTVTFIDATSGVTVGTTNVGTGTGVTTTATFQFTPTAANDATYPAGFNQFTATYNGGTYYHSVGPVNGNPAYIGGLLFSLTLAHNFSTDPGTVDGTPTTPYGIQVYNFTAAGVSSSLNFTNSNQGTNAFGYSTNCPVTIAAGATCEIVFTYLPPYGDGNSTTVGRYEAGSWSVTATGTILGVGIKGFASPPRAGVATFPAVLAGKALLPVGSLSVTPLSYTFGPLAPGAQSKTLQISVTNPNTTAVGVLYTLPTGAFTTVNNCPSTLNGNATCQIQVTFKSSTVGTQTASVTLNPAGGPAITVSLTGIVQSGTGLVMSTDNHGFGNIPVGQSGTQFGLNIKNNAATAATLSFSQSQGGTTPFNVATGGCPASLAAGAQCSVIANFTPTAAGAVSDVLTVTSNQPIIPGGTGTGPYSATVTFTGAGTTSATFNASTSTHNWGNIPVATTGSNYGVQLTNNTAAAITLTLGTGFANNKGFSLLGSNCGASLAVNASCELIFTFTPTATGTVTTTYGVSANGGAVQLYSLANAGYVSGITLIGTGVAQ